MDLQGNGFEKHWHGSFPQKQEELRQQHFFFYIFVLLSKQILKYNSICKLNKNKTDDERNEDHFSKSTWKYSKKYNKI